ncbi:MAG: cytochrome P450 [Solirubrobacteraceae bacterium]
MTAAPDEPDFDPLDDAFVRDPHPTWERLRGSCPVARGARWDFWALTRYDDIKEVSRRPKVFTSAHGITVPRNPVSGRRAPLHFDPPEHPLYRRPLNAVFSGEHVAELEPRIRVTAARLVADLVTAGGGDVVGRLSSPLTGVVFGMFLGIDEPEARALNDHSERFEWAQGHRRAEIAEEENLYLYERCREIVARRRAHPTDPQRDVVTALHEVRIDGEPLDDEFIAGSLRQLLIAAHVAPTAAIASAVKHLAQDRDLQAGLRAEPQLIADAVEEFLRLYTPNQGFARTATEQTSIRGRQVQPGEQVALVLTSANRDESVFEDADRFVLGRSPNPHIAFGHGAHKCAGQPVARAEMGAALEELLAQTSEFTLAGEGMPLHWPLYGPEQLPVRCVARG